MHLLSSSNLKIWHSSVWCWWGQRLNPESQGSAYPGRLFLRKKSPHTYLRVTSICGACSQNISVSWEGWDRQLCSSLEKTWRLFGGSRVIIWILQCLHFHWKWLGAAHWELFCPYCWWVSCIVTSRTHRLQLVVSCAGKNSRAVYGFPMVLIAGALMC